MFKFKFLFLLQPSKWNTARITYKRALSYKKSSTKQRTNWGPWFFEIVKFLCSNTSHGKEHLTKEGLKIQHMFWEDNTLLGWQHKGVDLCSKYVNVTLIKITVSGVRRGLKLLYDPQVLLENVYCRKTSNFNPICKSYPFRVTQIKFQFSELNSYPIPFCLNNFQCSIENRYMQTNLFADYVLVPPNNKWRLRNFTKALESI